MKTRAVDKFKQTESARAAKVAKALERAKIETEKEPVVETTVGVVEDQVLDTVENVVEPKPVEPVAPVITPYNPSNQDEWLRVLYPEGAVMGKQWVCRQETMDAMWVFDGEGRHACTFLRRTPLGKLMPFKERAMAYVDTQNTKMLEAV